MPAILAQVAGSIFHALERSEIFISKRSAEAKQPLNRRMGQPANSPVSSRRDEAEPAISRAEDGASASEQKEEERLDSEALIDAADRGELARVKEIIGGKNGY